MTVLAAEECGCAYADTSVSMADSCGGGGALLFLLLLESFIKGRCDLSDPCRRVQDRDTLDESYDFIVVGGGSAGSVVASRLSENSDFKVLLLEAGGDEPVQSAVPSFYRSYWNNAQTDWLYRTEPQDNACLDQKGRCVWPRGKMLGGSSVINGMMYHRGHAADYEDWVRLGAKGWSYEENRPFFDRAEDNRQVGSLVSREYHAQGGMLPVQTFRFQPELAGDILLAADEAGLPLTNDMNGANKIGLTIAQTYNDGGSRYTTSRAYLRPASNRTNLHVRLHAQVTKVLLDGTRVTGVQYYHKGQNKTVRASREVILSAGALNSPHILMLSGIGPRDTLEQFEIPVVKDLPGVGQNLQNHVGVNLYFVLEKLPATQDLNWENAMQYMLARDGLMASTGITQVTGVLYSSFADKAREQPDLQFFFNGFYAECSRTGDILEAVDLADPSAYKEISMTGVLVLPHSKGFLTLQSADPLKPPIFFPNFFANRTDVEQLKEAARFLYMIANTTIMREKWGLKSNVKHIAPCLKKGPEGSDEFLECMISLHTDPQNHQCGTTAMGSADNPEAVLDPQLRVYGIQGLRVADASVMPQVPTGNPVAAIIMIAERAADFIKKDHEKKCSHPLQCRSHHASRL